MAAGFGESRLAGVWYAAEATIAGVTTCGKDSEYVARKVLVTNLIGEPEELKGESNGR